jgi:hypothetical protein
MRVKLGMAGSQQELGKQVGVMQCLARGMGRPVASVIILSCAQLVSDENTTRMEKYRRAQSHTVGIEDVIV